MKTEKIFLIFSLSLSHVLSSHTKILQHSYEYVQHSIIPHNTHTHSQILSLKGEKRNAAYM